MTLFIIYFQLIARLGKKASLEGLLEPVLFPNGPQHKNIMELYGEEGTGKTQMLIHFTARCILPEKWKGLSIGGLGISVIFIDTDYHLSMIRMATLLEACVMAHIQEDQDREAPTSEDVESLVKRCLQQLFIVRCKSSSQLFITLDYLENLLSNKPDIGAIMIDSISAFYWIDKCAGGDSIQAQELNMKRIATILKRLVDTYNLVVFATKSVMYQKHGHKSLDSLGESSSRQSSKFTIEHCEYLPKTWSRIISHRLLFSKETMGTALSHGKPPQGFSVWFDVGGDKLKQFFTIGERGVTFST